MIGPAFLCGQFATLLLGAGSVRGSGILFRKLPPRPYRLTVQIGGASLLALSLFLAFHHSLAPLIDIITWIGFLGLNTLITALALTALNVRKSSTR